MGQHRALTAMIALAFLACGGFLRPCRRRRSRRAPRRAIRLLVDRAGGRSAIGPTKVRHPHQRCQRPPGGVRHCRSLCQGRGVRRRSDGGGGACRRAGGLRGDACRAAGAGQPCSRPPHHVARRRHRAARRRVAVVVLVSISDASASTAAICGACPLDPSTRRPAASAAGRCLRPFGDVHRAGRGCGKPASAAVGHRPGRRQPLVDCVGSVGRWRRVGGALPGQSR